MPAAPAPIRPASSVLVVRDGPPLEIFMVRRVRRGFFGGLMVFPGGAVDRCDHGELASQVVVGEADDLWWRSAALRELAEETGIALGGSGFYPAPEGEGDDLYGALHQKGLTLDARRLTFLSRWVTPEGAPTRFDTKFYLAEIHGDPEVRLDPGELEDGIWVTAATALDREASGEWHMFTPTVAHLTWLARHETVESARVDAIEVDRKAPVQVRVMDDGSIVPAGLPGDPR